MRILIITQLFQPEPNHLKGVAYAKELQKQGHQVQILTGFPNYPGGKVYSGYKIQMQKRDVVNGVEVIRVAHYPSHNNSGIERILNYLSFAIIASTVGIFSIQRPDIIHVYQGSPTLMLPAWIARIFYQSRILLDIQDIWPESVKSSGMLKIPGGIWLLNIWCTWTYKYCDQIITLSTGYKSLIEQRGANPAKVNIVYNWTDETSIASFYRDPEIANRFSLENKFNIIFAGNMGKVQSLDAVLDSAELVIKDLPSVQFVFVGGGIDVERLKKLAYQRNLSNVIFIPRQPASEISKIIAYADSLLIHLRDDELGRIGIPQKTQASLAAGKPIIMAVAGEAANIVKESNSGLVCIPEDSESITAAVKRLFYMSANEREILGRNGQQYYRNNLSFEIGTAKILDIYRTMIDEKRFA